MLGKGVTAKDCLVVMAAVLPAGALVGAGLGYFGDRFGFTAPARVLVMAMFCGLAGHFARIVVSRRVKARAARQG